jgi:ABC-type amino acid transport substrate-binding protein
MDHVKLLTYLRIGIFSLGAFYSLTSHALPIDVKVGGYPYAPFVMLDDGNIKGITPDLITLLNASQDKYHFRFVLTSSKRRFVYFDQGLIDALFFEQKKWGWQDKAVIQSEGFLKGGGVFIAVQDGAKTQGYFRNIKNKSLAGSLGFHYNLAEFDPDETKLKDVFNMSLKTSFPSILQTVISGRSDIGILGMSYIKWEMGQKKELSQKLIVSNYFDQELNHGVLLRENAAITIKDINNLLKAIHNNGSLSKLLQRYNLEPIALPSI